MVVLVDFFNYVLLREALMEGKEVDDLPSLPMSQSQLQYKIDTTDLNRKANIDYINTYRQAGYIL